MNSVAQTVISASTYARDNCAVGVVHLGFGAFHRAHQAVYIDRMMQKTGDLNWGIAAVNLRATEAEQFQTAVQDIARHDGYYLQSYAPDGTVSLERVRAHVAFADWSTDAPVAEAYVALPSVHLITITVTESGYYTDPQGHLDSAHPVITAEAAGGARQSVYAYLRHGLALRRAATAAPLTIACCDNIRQNGHMLRRNLLAYLAACGEAELHDWVAQNVSFPCSMVDRITPRAPEALAQDVSRLVGGPVAAPIMAEEFLQWVLEDRAAGPMPDLAKAGVTVTADVDPYEETKIRVLNGGHTALTYFAALEGLHTFDEAMRLPHLRAHFDAFEAEEVLAAITITLPFEKTDYLAKITARFGNRAIGDTVARICADGMAKFPIFVRPTLEGCLKQGILPRHAIRSIASWHSFAQHVAAGKIVFHYVEPGWALLKPMLGTEDFVQSTRLWGDLPKTYPEFAAHLRSEISQMELKWPV